MIYLFYLACIVLYIVSPCNLALGVSVDHMVGIFTYQFMHANVLHLIVNILSLCLMYNPIKKIYETRFSAIRIPNLFVVLYISSVMVGGFCALPEPTVGASGMVFFILGAILGLRPTKQQFINYIWIFLGVIVSAIAGHSNTLLHIVAFLIGVVFAILRIKYDDCRTEHNRRVQTN